MIIEQDINHSVFKSLCKSLHQDLLVELLATVKHQGYKFVTVTPHTHQRFLAKITTPGNNLRDIFGWNLPFSIDALCPLIKRIMLESNLIEPHGNLMRSRLRISSLGNDLFLHSGFPTEENDAVFFGPDTYRFARFIRHSLDKNQFAETATSPAQPVRILDIGCGTGAGGIAAVRTLPRGRSFELIMNDVNETALGLTRINAQVADVPITLMKGNIFEALNSKFDLIIANPPYMSDDLGRAYRDGGSGLGLDLSIRIFKTAFDHLAPKGKLILYTGVAMTSQSDPFSSTIMPLLADTSATWSYEEIDPDIFGEELELPAYCNAHRIAAVGLVVTKP